MIRRCLTALVCVIGLTSCETLSEDQCKVGDWRRIGYEDGAGGSTLARLEEHAKACTKFGVAPDSIAYDQGRRDGLAQYCTPNRGFRVGKAGSTYAGVCPPGMEGGFLAGLADGAMVHAADQRRSQAASERSRAEQQIKTIDADIRTEEAKLADKTTTPEAKEVARGRIKRLAQDRDRAFDDVRRAERRELDAGREMDSLRARFTPAYGTW